MEDVKQTQQDVNRSTQILEDLTEDEKSVLRSILNDVSSNGKSDQLTDLYYEDYEEIPVDLMTFLCDDLYLGNYTNHGRDIYNTWVNELKYVHNPINFVDQWAITGSTGTGKAQPLDSLVFTPDGYIKMRDIKLGDTVVDGLGKLTKVTHIYPQGKKPVYKVTFSDRTSVLCANDHLWKVGQNKGKGIKYETLSLEDIMTKGLRKSDRWRFRIPTSIIDVWSTSTTIDPYLMGILLGDGCLQSDQISICNPEDDIIQKVNSIVTSMGYELHKKADITYTIYGKGKFGNRTDGSFIHPLKDYLQSKNLLCKSINKHIPEEYLYTTVENRVKLLQGLFDTDGYVDDRHTRSVLRFNTSSRQLSDDFAFLVRSLGGTDTVITKQKGYKLKGETEYKYISDTYEHIIKLPENILPFSSEKHTKKYAKPQFGPIRRIVDIQYIGEQDCQCIVVDSADHTYFTDNLTVTHNSTVATYSLCYELYKLMCLKNPNRFYLGADETIWFLFFNVTLKMAEKTMWRKVPKSTTKKSLVYGKGNCNR